MNCFFTVEEFAAKKGDKLQECITRICVYLEKYLAKIINKYDAKDLYRLYDLKADL